MPLPHLVAARPEDVGVSAAALQQLFEAAEAQVLAGHIDSCSVAVARHGRLAGAAAFGVDPHGRPVTTSSLLQIYSSTKAVVAAAAWQLIDRGALSPSARVAELFPEFGENGKEDVSVEQLLTFTAGLPPAEGGDGMEEQRAKMLRLGTTEGRVAALRELRLVAPPGERYGYCPWAPYAVAECIERATGRDFREYIRAELLEPMGLRDVYCGGEREVHHHFVDSVAVGVDAAPAVYGTTVPLMNEPAVQAAMAPGGGMLCSASELALFYQPLLRGGAVAGRDGPPLISPDTLAQATTVHTDERHFEELGGGAARLPTLRGWMVEVAGDDTVHLPPGLRASDGVHGMGGTADGMEGETPGKVLRGCFGYSNSAATFGHNGAGGQAGWGDPATGISFAFLTNTFSEPAEEPRKKRVVDLATLANVCAGGPAWRVHGLGLAGRPASPAGGAKPKL
eukprot:COSAG04_NODE_2780_length_3594_cov_5.982546_3_plen_452_part_00